ncbi:unnamed protein product, partial [Medioppia subpectinata]
MSFLTYNRGNCCHCLQSLSKLIIFIALISLSNGDRIKQKIYKPIESNYFCFRRLNATHQIGCQSKEGGNVGAVYVINNETDMDHVLNTGRHYPYIPVITPKDFNLETLKRFKSSDRITGVLVLDIKGDERKALKIEGLSPDKTCPNDGFGLYTGDKTHDHCGQQEWNLAEGLTERHNDGLMFNDWPFPIFLIKNETNIAQIRDCFKRFGGPNYPLCGVQLEAPMNAAKDSVSCVRRTALQRSSYSLSQTFFCDPLGGHNIFSTLLYTSKTDKIADNSVIVLAARLDSFSMFDNVSPGADSALTSLVTLLAVAKTLNEYRNDLQQKANNRNVLYALFDGEAFDYIGSSRTVYDMNNDRFPVDPNSEKDLAQLKTKHISHFIELNQLATHGNDAMLYIHKNLKSNVKTKQLVDKLIQYGTQVTEIEDNRPLPPASLQVFLKDSQEIGGVVIANHKKEYTNKYYNSLYDDSVNVNINDTKLAQRLTTIATAVSKTIYELITQETTKDITVNQTFVESLINCYMNNSVCDLFKYVSEPTAQRLNDYMDPLPTYVGVFGSSTMSSISRAYTMLLLSRYTGEEHSDKTKDECTDLNKKSMVCY